MRGRARTRQELDRELVSHAVVWVPELFRPWSPRVLTLEPSFLLSSVSACLPVQPSLPSQASSATPPTPHPLESSRDLRLPAKAGNQELGKALRVRKGLPNFRAVPRMTHSPGWEVAAPP